MKKIFVALAALMFAFPAVAYATPNHDQNGDHTKPREIMVHLVSDMDAFSVNGVDFVHSGSKYKSTEKFEHSPIDVGVSYDVYCGPDRMGSMSFAYHTGSHNANQGEWQYDATFVPTIPDTPVEDMPELIDDENPDPDPNDQNDNIDDENVNPDDQNENTDEPIEEPSDNTDIPNSDDVIDTPDPVDPVAANTEQINTVHETELPKTGDDNRHMIGILIGLIILGGAVAVGFKIN